MKNGFETLLGINKNKIYCCKNTKLTLYVLFLQQKYFIKLHDSLLNKKRLLFLNELKTGALVPLKYLFY